MISRTLLLLGFLAALGVTRGNPDTSLSSRFDNPIETNDALLQDFITHKDDIVRWIECLSDRQRSPRLPTISCTACRTVVGLGVTWIRQGQSQETISNSLLNLCVSLNLVAREICIGAIERYIAPSYFIISERTYLKATDLCAILIPNADCGVANETLSNWDISVDGNKPPVLSPAPLPSNQPTVPVLQLTDIHLDLNYVVGSQGNCDDPLCCRKPVPENSTDARVAGAFGDYSCDFPLPAMNELFEDAAARYNYSFVILSGDYVHHAIWATKPEENMQHNTEVANKLRSLFPNTPVYPVIGNHEPHPCNLFPPRSVWDLEGGDFNLGWMYDSIATLYQQYLPQDALATLRQAGYYTVRTPQGLRLVVLNTNFCYTLNFWLYYDTVDPEGQLQWFADTMLAAERAGEIVYIVGHVPPGHSECWSTWSSKFDRIINRFENIIQAQFYGHTHNDDLKIFFEGSDSGNGTTPRPTNSLYIGASATTYTDLNPGYKVYHVDGSPSVANRTWEILDHETFIYNLTEANLVGKTNWRRMYSAREAYGLRTLRPADLYDFVERMVNDVPLFQEWYSHYNKDADTMEPCVETECRLQYLCDAVTTDVADQSHCERLRSLLNPESYSLQ